MWREGPRRGGRAGGPPAGPERRRCATGAPGGGRGGKEGPSKGPRENAAESCRTATAGIQEGSSAQGKILWAGIAAVCSQVTYSGRCTMRPGDNPEKGDGVTRRKATRLECSQSEDTVEQDPVRAGGSQVQSQRSWF